MNKIIAPIIVALGLGGCGFDSPSCRSAITAFDEHVHDVEMLRKAVSRSTSPDEKRDDVDMAAGRIGLVTARYQSDGRRFCRLLREPAEQVRPKYERVLRACGSRPAVAEVEPHIIEANNDAIATLRYCRWLDDHS